MIHKTFTYEFANIDYLTWLLNQRTYYQDGDPLFIDAECPGNFVTFREMLDNFQKIAKLLRAVERIGINGPGNDVVLMYSSNQV